MTDHAWCDALDLALVARLWRPIARPGLVRAGQAQAILARHQGMVAGLPLAALLQRRGTAVLDVQAAQLPIVYARPHAWPAAAGAVSGVPRPQAGGSPAQPTPVVRATLAPPAHTPPGSGGMTPQRTLAATPTSGSAAQAVVQRKPAPALAAPVTTPRAARPSADPHPAGTHLSSGSGGKSQSSGSATESSDRFPSHAEESCRPGELPAGAHPVVKVTRIAATPADVPGLPLVTPGLILPGHAVDPSATPASGGPSLPVVRVEPAGHNENQPAAVTTWALPLPAPEQNGVSAVPVVHERIVHDRAEYLSLPIARQQPVLPLANGTVPTARPAAEPAPPAAATSPTSERHALSAARGAVPMQPAAAPEPAVRAAEPNHPAPAQVTIDRIVDQVHRRFIHRLAIEGERRGMAR